MPALLPIQALVNGNPVEPRGEVCFGPKPIQVLVSVDEGLLGQILRVRQRAGHPIAERVNHALMVFDQIFNSAVVALLALDYPTSIVICRDHALIFNQFDNPGRGIL